MDIFRNAILLSIFLLALFVSPGDAQNTTYAVEIEVRQKKIKTLQKNLIDLNRKINKNEALMRDYKKMYFKLAEQYGKEQKLHRKYGKQNLVDKNLPPDVTAALILKDPSSHKIPKFEQIGPFRHPLYDHHVSLSLAGGAFQVKDVGDLITIYNQTTTIMKTAVPRTKFLKKLKGEVTNNIERLEKEIAALRRGKAADPSIIGNWMLVTGKNGSIVQVVRNPNTGSYAGVLKVNFLEFFQKGDTVFVVNPVRSQPGTFSGTEYGYTNSRLPKTSPLRIKINGTQMIYTTSEETLTWNKIKHIDLGNQRHSLVN